MQWGSVPYNLVRRWRRCKSWMSNKENKHLTKYNKLGKRMLTVIVTQSPLNLRMYRMWSIYIHNINILSMIYRLFARFLLILFHKHIKIFAFSTTSYLNTDGTDKFPQMKFNSFVLIVKTKVTGPLVMQGTRASGAIVLTLVYVIVAYSVWEGPRYKYGSKKKNIDNQIWTWKRNKYVGVALA